MTISRWVNEWQIRKYEIDMYNYTHTYKLVAIKVCVWIYINKNKFLAKIFVTNKTVISSTKEFLK